jgi:hypothetical protein
MSRMKAITVSSCVLAVLPGTLIPVVLLPSRPPYRDVVILLKEMPRLSPVLG